jgi:hypothetical protein
MTPRRRHELDPDVHAILTYLVTVLALALAACVVALVLIGAST